MEDKTLITLVLFLMLITLTLYVGIIGQKEVTDNFVSSCNQKYGINNWAIKETTGDTFYLRQEWKCEKK